MNLELRARAGDSVLKGAHLGNEAQFEGETRLNPKGRPALMRVQISYQHTPDM